MKAPAKYKNTSKRSKNKAAGQVARQPMASKANPASRPARRQKKPRKVQSISNLSSVSSGYIFVVKNRYGEWRFVDHEYATTLTASMSFSHVYPVVTDQMREFWRKVVIDDAFDWDSRSSVDPKSLRLVKVNIQTQDATAQLFDDDSLMRQGQRLAALSKLTVEEAEALGIANQHVMMRMHKAIETDRDELRDFGDKMIDARVSLNIAGVCDE